MTADELHRMAAAWLSQGRRARIVEVLQAQGSVPRETGARMLVSVDAAAGTIGGGHLELQAIDEAHVALRQGDEAVTRRQVALGPSLGQCCGGTVTLQSTPLDAASLAAWPPPVPRFTLQLHGAGHIGRAVAGLLADIDCHVRWIDEREAEFPDDVGPPHIERVCVDQVHAEVGDAPPDAFYLVMTHSHAVDLQVVEAVLRRGDFGFLGLIGSDSKRARFEHRLLERGLAAERLARLVCPIGLPGIEGKQPGVVAVSAVAQLLQLSR
jgi:xanthine dehydrogenase accessory factor